MNAFLARIAAAFVGLTLLLAVSPRGETSTAKDESLSKRLKDPSPAVANKRRWLSPKPTTPRRSPSSSLCSPNCPPQSGSPLRSC